MLRRLIEYLKSVWRWLFATGPSRRIEDGMRRPDVVTLDATVDPAPAVRAGKFVLVGPENHAKWLVFACPCGCGDDVRLNLMQKFSPRWTVERTQSGITVHPSVDMQTCGAHFWVRDGAIVWAATTLSDRGQ